MNIEEAQKLISGDMAEVNKIIEQRLASDVVLVNQLSQYIIHSGGKRLRPQLVLLAAQACGYQGKTHYLVAAIIEFIHTATLLHDDVVDASDLRRGKDTANSIWGNEAAVLVGDFLYSRSFEMMVDVNVMEIMKILSTTTNIIAEGEVMQLMNVHDADTTEATYMDVIHCKTAKLFESATLLGALLAERSAEDQQAIAEYGMHLGTAFQIIDDVLDYSASAEDMGKNVGDDLAEGKPTLPLIYAQQHGNADQKKLIRHAIIEGGLQHLDKIMVAITETGALDYSRNIAQKEAELAKSKLACLADSKHKDAMLFLADYSVSRGF